MMDVPPYVSVVIAFLQIIAGAVIWLSLRVSSKDGPGFGKTMQYVVGLMYVFLGSLTLVRWLVPQWVPGLGPL